MKRSNANEIVPGKVTVGNPILKISISRYGEFYFLNYINTFLFSELVKN